MGNEVDDIFAEYEPRCFEDDFSGRLMDRIEVRREREAAIIPLFMRTGLAAAVLMLCLVSYNLTSTEEGDVLERLFGVPPSTTILEAYSHDLEPTL